MVKFISFGSLRQFVHDLLGFRSVKIDGIRVICDKSRMDPAICKSLLRGSYELPERVLVRAAIRPTDNVLEIGAGIGVVSLICARLAVSGQVTSYEANSSLAPMIIDNFSLNGLSPKLILKAVTVIGGSIDFFKNENFVSSSTIDRNFISEKITVESDSIDKAIEDAKANVIVMDVEGAEVDLLTKANLKNVREIIVEIHPHIVGDFLTQEMICAIVERGFRQKKRQHKTIWFTKNDK